MKRIIPLICWLTFALALFSSGCVAPQPYLAVTPSGKPEMVINAPVGKIKAAIIGDMVNNGYAGVEQDTEYMLRFSRPVDGKEAFGAALSTGNAYSTNKRVVTFTFVPTADGVRVIVSNAWTAQMPGGQTNTTELNSGEIFNYYYMTLQSIKAGLEKHTEAK